MMLVAPWTWLRQRRERIEQAHREAVDSDWALLPRPVRPVKPPEKIQINMHFVPTPKEDEKPEQPEQPEKKEYIPYRIRRREDEQAQ